ncbi:restriction endonuclease subunit S [Flavobacteriaceae bacterium]|nr:restriction endonuclease subunit S [Flavobacteriaceae bacterium]
MDVITENTVNPAKRFSSFKSNWMTKLYEDIYSFYSTNSLSRDKLNYENGEVFNIHYGDIHTKFSTMFDLTKELVPIINVEVDLSKCEDEKYCQEGDLVIADASEDYEDVGKTIELINLNNEKVLAGLHTFLARPNNYKMAKGFAGYLLQSWKVRRQVMVIAQGSKVLGITKGRLGKVKLNIPEFEEQQKIASFLSAVDEKIQQLNKKKELLSAYKKGIMQKIFSQELRFKDDSGNNYPDWEEKKLGDIGNFKTSSVDKLIKEGEQLVSLINWMNVYKHQTITNENTKELMQVSAQEKQIEISNLKRGDILFTPSSETPSDIGHSIVIFEDLYNTLYSYHLMRFRPIINLDILYSHYFCNVSSILKQISRFATGSTRFTISVGSFSKIIIQLPSLEEQQKIANFLSSIDSKIELVSTQIENTKAFKKGLLQQMFV